MAAGQAKARYVQNCYGAAPPDMPAAAGGESSAAGGSQPSAPAVLQQDQLRVVDGDAV